MPLDSPGLLGSFLNGEGEANAAGGYLLCTIQTLI
jgi:hypothetical protein